MNKFNYTEFISRNYAYINDDLQDKIRQTRLVFAGCGLASVMAEAAARIGFVHFTLFDPDKVELSNLNRQNFYIHDIATYKVEAVKKTLLNINPTIQVKTFTQKITTTNDIHQAIQCSDVLINTIDYDAAYFELVHTGMRENKLIICAFNPGFAGLAACFTQRSGTLFDLLKTNEIVTGLEFPRLLRVNNTPSQLPVTFLDNFYALYEKIQQRNYNPQLVIGAHITSAIVLNCIIQYLNQEDIPLAPTLIYKEIG